LWKLADDEVSFTSDGRAFHARGPAIKKALSATHSWVWRAAKLLCTLDRRRHHSAGWVMSDIARKYLNNVKHWRTQLKLNSARHWQPVGPLQGRWFVQPCRCTTEVWQQSLAHVEDDGVSTVSYRPINCCSSQLMTVLIHLSVCTVCHSPRDGTGGTVANPP